MKKLIFCTLIFFFAAIINSVAQADEELKDNKKNDQAALDKSMKVKKSKEQLKYEKDMKKIHDQKEKRNKITRKQAEKKANQRLHRASTKTTQKKKKYVKSHNK
jgi:hypothetical protein